MQFANVDSVTVIPHGVTVIVRKRGGRRIVIAVNVLDDTVRVVQPDCNVSSGKKTFQFAAIQIEVWVIGGVGKRLVNIRGQNAAGVRADVALHLLSLPYRLTELTATQAAEKREVCLHHQTKAVTEIINFLLDRSLRDAPEIHVTKFGEQDVVDQLRVISAHDVLLLKSHRICAAQTNGTIVQEKHTARFLLCLLAKRAEPKLAAVRINNAAGFVQQLELDLIQPRRIGFPSAKGCSRDANLVKVLSLSARKRQLCVQRTVPFGKHF